MAVQGDGWVAERRGDEAELAGRYDDARTAYAEALNLCADRVLRRAALLRKLALVDERVGAYEASLARNREALASLADETGPEAAGIRASVQAMVAGVTFRQGDIGSCQDWAEQAIASAREAGQPALLARARYLRALARRDLGVDGSLEDLHAALSIYEQLGDLEGLANVRTNLGVAAYYAGDWDAALEHYTLARVVSRRSGDVIAEATQANNIGELLSDQGRLEEAASALGEAYRAFRAARYSLQWVVLANVGRLELRRGYLERARDHLEDALEEFRRVGAADDVGDVRLRLAEWEVHAGNWHAAYRQLLDLAPEEAAGATDLSREVTRLRLLATALTHFGRYDEARAALDEAQTHATGLGAGIELLGVLHARAHLACEAGDFGALDTEAERAADLATQLSVVAVPVIPTPAAQPVAAGTPADASTAPFPTNAAPTATRAPAARGDNVIAFPVTHAALVDDPSAERSERAGWLELVAMARGLATWNVAVTEDDDGVLWLSGDDPEAVVVVLQRVVAVLAADPDLPVPRVRVALTPVTAVTHD